MGGDIFGGYSRRVQADIGMGVTKKEGCKDGYSRPG